MPFASFFSSEPDKRLLSKDEERELGRRIERGRSWRYVPGKAKKQPFLNADAKDAAQELVAHNPRLVMREVLRLDHSKRIPQEDLLGHGLTGLTEGAMRWRWRRGRFSTYAYFWIRKEILRCMVNESRVVKIPAGARAEVREAIKSSKFKGFKKTCKYSSRALDAMRLGLYQEQSIGRDYNPSDRGAGDPALAMEKLDRRAQAFRIMARLTQKKRDILTLRFINRMTIKEIAHRMRMARKTVQRLSREALVDVRNRVRLEEE